MTSKYIVRQPIKDADKHIIGYEIQYYGENHAEFHDIHHYAADEKDAASFQQG